jgi:hypothetical protein
MDNKTMILGFVAIIAVLFLVGNMDITGQAVAQSPSQGGKITQGGTVIRESVTAAGVKVVDIDQNNDGTADIAIVIDSTEPGLKDFFDEKYNPGSDAEFEDVQAASKYQPGTYYATSSTNKKITSGPGVKVE